MDRSSSNTPLPPSEDPLAPLLDHPNQETERGAAGSLDLPPFETPQTHAQILAAIYSPHEKTELERCQLIVKDKGVVAADLIARSLCQEADRFKEQARLADASWAKLEIDRLWLEAIMKETDLHTAVEQQGIDDVAGSVTTSEALTRAEDLQRIINSQQHDRLTAKRAWAAADERFVLSELIRDAIIIEGERHLRTDLEAKGEPNAAEAPLPFLPPQEIIYKRDGVSRLKGNALWPRLGQWIVNEILLIHRHFPDIVKDADVAREVDRRLNVLMAKEEPGGEGWVVNVVERELDRRDAKAQVRPIAPVRFGREQLRDLKDPVLAGEFGEIGEPWLGVLRKIFQRGAEGG